SVSSVHLQPFSDRVHVPVRPEAALPLEKQLPYLGMLLADRLLGVDVMKLKLNNLRWVVSPDRSGPSNATRSRRFRVGSVKGARASRRPRRRAAEAGAAC